MLFSKCPGHISTPHQKEWSNLLLLVSLRLRARRFSTLFLKCPGHIWAPHQKERSIPFLLLSLRKGAGHISTLFSKCPRRFLTLFSKHLGRFQRYTNRSNSNNTNLPLIFTIFTYDILKRASINALSILKRASRYALLSFLGTAKGAYRAPEASNFFKLKT